MKKGFRLLLTVVILLALAAGALSGPGVHAAASDMVKISMKVGFDKFYKIGSTTPFYFEIDNKLKDINGELQIEMPNQNENITIYAMNVSLPKNSSKKFIINIPVSVFCTKLKVNLVEGKNTIAAENFRIDPGASAETYAVGILSDDFDSMKYINKITIKNLNNFSTRNVRLDEGSLPESADALETFNIIVINNFDTSRLSSPQYEALKRWVSDGGVLIIGTGPSQNKTLAIFKDDFIKGEVGENKVLHTSSLHKMAEVKSVEAMDVTVSDIAIKGSTPVIKDGDTVILQKVEIGRGVAVVASFDFGLEPLSSWTGNTALADKIISAVLPRYYQTEMYQKGMSMKDNLYAIDNALRNIPELPRPKTIYLAIIYIAYILMAAPLGYIILKRMDKREFMWIAVPILSVVFSGVVYYFGAGTRITGPVTNVISIVEIDNTGIIIPKIYAGVFTPYKENMRLEAGEGFDIHPLMENNGNYRGRMSAENIPRKVDSKVIVSPRTVLEFYQNGVWTMRTVALETDEVFSGKLESNINYAKGAFSGTVKNTSGFDLEECYIITPSQYVSLGPVRNGETKQINIKPSSYYGQRYDLINAIYKDPYSGKQSSGKRKKLTAEEIAEFRKSNQKRQVMEYGFTNEAYQGFEAKLMGWSSTPVSGKLLVNGKETRRYEKSFITSKVNLSFRDGNNIEYPLGFLKPDIINNLTSGNYDEYGKTFFGTGSFEVHYKIDGNINTENVNIKYTIGNGQRVRQYIWDNQKGDWVSGDYRNFSISGSLLEKYIGSDNTLKLKIEMDDDNVQLPQITVKGSAR